MSILLFALLLSRSAHAQEVAPQSYLFVEVADATGALVSGADVRVSGPDGKELVNLKTEKDGTTGRYSFRVWSIHHYNLQVSKPGYLTYESVLVSNIPNNSYFARLTDELPDIPESTGSANVPPIKITLQRIPTTPREIKAAELDANKHQLLMAIKRGDKATVEKLLQQGANANWTDAKGVPAVAWATFGGDPEMIKLLLDAGANVRNKAGLAHEALLIYLAEGVNRYRLNVEIIDKLLAAGADVNAFNSYRGRVLNKAILHVPHSLSLETWVYQYAIMLALLGFGAANQKAVVAANQIVVATLYFWSGLHKLSWSFVHDVAPRLIESTGVHLSPRTLIVVALAIAVCETLIGVSLLLRRTRRVAVVLACVMHAIILVTLIFARLNTVVWPWNVAMIAITIILFGRRDQSPFASLTRDYLPKVALLICGLLPALSFVGWWDLYLSGALYSGKSPVAVMRIGESLRDRLPASAREVTFKTSRGELMLPLFEWSSSELNVPPYPELRVYREIAHQLCASDTNTNANALIIKGRPSLTDGSSQVTMTSCAELLNNSH